MCEVRVRNRAGGATVGIRVTCVAEANGFADEAKIRTRKR